MESIAFVLWVVGWYITDSVSSYIEAKRKHLQGHNQSTEEDEKFNGSINFIIWVVVSIILFYKMFNKT